MRRVWFGLVLLMLWTVRAEAGTTELSWIANTETDLAGYRIYHFAGPTCPTGPLPPLMIEGKSVVVLKPATTYVHTGPTVEGTWCYEITAFDVAGNESGRSNRVSKVFDSSAPKAPTLSLRRVTP